MCVCVQGCVPCHELCETCTAKTLSFCLTCKYFSEEDKCVDKCDKDYFVPATDITTCHRCHTHCDRCWGPTESNCVRCKGFTIYDGLGLGEENEGDEGADNKSLAVSGTCWQT